MKKKMIITVESSLQPKASLLQQKYGLKKLLVGCNLTKLFHST